MASSRPRAVGSDGTRLDPGPATERQDGPATPPTSEPRSASARLVHRAV